jgi:hypothetical protein
LLRCRTAAGTIGLQARKKRGGRHLVAAIAKALPMFGHTH